MTGRNRRSERKTLRQYCEENPHVAFILTQWHPTKNGGVTPDDVYQTSRMPVWWLCEKGHEWQTQAASRTGAQAVRCAGRNCCGRGARKRKRRRRAVRRRRGNEPG